MDTSVRWKIVFGYLSAITPGGLLDIEVSLITIQTINTIFFLLGILGFIAVVGLLLIENGNSVQQSLSVS